MFEFLAGLVTGWLFTWPALVVLCLLGTFAEHHESRGFTTFLGLVAAVSAYYYFKVPFADAAIYFVGYLVVGFVWSFWRYKRYVTAKISKLSEVTKYDLGLLHPSKHLGTITNWILFWPFSFVDSFIGDFINIIQTLVSKVFKNVYLRIYQAAIEDLNMK